MFSGLNQPASNTGSLFGSTSNNQQQDGKRGLFDSSSATQPARPSPFSGNTTATPPTLQSGFGTQQSNPSTQPQSIYSGANPPSSAQPAMNSSLFGSSLTQGAQLNQQGGPQQAPGQSSLSSQQPMQPAFFSSLLERGKKRPHPSTLNATSVELPNLQLGLDDIRRTARGLGTTDSAASDQPSFDNKA